MHQFQSFIASEHKEGDLAPPFLYIIILITLPRSRAGNGDKCF